MILFLNKTDLFAQKIIETSINIAFPMYKGNVKVNLYHIFLVMQTHSHFLVIKELRRELFLLYYSKDMKIYSFHTFNFISNFLMFLSGARTYEEQIKFIQKQFESQNDNPKKKLYVHRTCATDTKQVEAVIGSVLASILANNMKEMGIQ
jgi:hypothetical protein